jgi:hypothetical protein
MEIISIIISDTPDDDESGVGADLYIHPEDGVVSMELNQDGDSTPIVLTYSEFRQLATWLAAQASRLEE